MDKKTEHIINNLNVLKDTFIEEGNLNGTYATKTAIKHINQQAETIESLKCCGNCKHCSTVDLVIGDRDCNHEDVCKREMPTGDNQFLDLWQPTN